MPAERLACLPQAMFILRANFQSARMCGWSENSRISFALAFSPQFTCGFSNLCTFSAEWLSFLQLLTLPVRTSEVFPIQLIEKLQPEPGLPNGNRIVRLIAYHKWVRA